MHLPDTDEEIDLEVFESAVHVFVSENIAPNSTFIIIIILVEVTSQNLVTVENVTSFVDIYFNITGNVGPRPVPWDFDFPYYVGYGFENNLTGFLGTLEEEKEKAEHGPPVVGVSDSEVEERPKENKLDTVAIIFIALFLLFLLLLLLCLCWRCCHRKVLTQDEEVIGPTESDELVEEEDQDDDDYTEISEKPSELGWPPKASNLHKYPFSNVHDCKSAYCPTCVNKADEGETGFVDVTESKSFGARIAAAVFSPRSFSLRSTWSTPRSTGRSTGRSTDDDVSR